MANNALGPDENWVENDLVYKVIGAGMTVNSALKNGLREKTYERALAVEFRHLGLAFTAQKVYPVYYKAEKVDEYTPDLEVEGRVIVETKVVDAIVDEHIGQVMNYLKISGLQAGVILNFRHSSLQFRKVVLTRG